MEIENFICSLKLKFYLFYMILKMLISLKAIDVYILRNYFTVHQVIMLYLYIFVKFLYT